MCKERRGKGKPTLGVFGLVSAAAFGFWVKVKVTGSHTAPAVKAPAQAAQVAATGAGISTGAVVVWAIVAAVFGVAAWFVVGKIRDMYQDRRADQARYLDQVDQIKARSQQREIEPLKWRYTLTERIDNELVTLGSQVFEYPATSKHEVAREVERRAIAKRPGNYNVKVELVSK